MNERDLTQLKKLLSRRREELLNGSDCNLEGLLEPDEISPDIVDQASRVHERNFAYRLCHRNNRHLREIERALRRIEEGLYGICEECGEDIAVKRLKARPTARYCIDCKTRLEKIERLTGGA